MVLAKEMCSKSILKVSVSDNETSSEESESEIEDQNSEDLSDSAKESIDDESEALMTNEGWADSISKILGSNKPKSKKTLVLSRAKKFSQIVKVEKEEKPAFEIIGETIKTDPDVDKKTLTTGEPPTKIKKTEKPSIRGKPNILEKDRERLLNKIATKGVIQLFNAVRNQQKTIEKEIVKSDLSESKKEKKLKKFDKRTFLDSLMGQTKSIIVDNETKTMKDEVKPEENTTQWSALRDDFMMGAKMKDWDKESIDE